MSEVQIASKQLWKITKPICNTNARYWGDTCREIIRLIEIVKEITTVTNRFKEKFTIWDCIVLIDEENPTKEGKNIEMNDKAITDYFEYVSPGYPSKEYNTWFLERPIDRDTDGAKIRRDNNQVAPTDSSNFVEGPCAKIINELEIWHDYDMPIKIGGVLAKTELKDIDKVRYEKRVHGTIDPNTGEKTPIKQLKPIPLVWKTVATELVINPKEFFAKAKYIDPEYYNKKRAQQALHEGVCVVGENENSKFEYKYNFKF